MESSISSIMAQKKSSHKFHFKKKRQKNISSILIENSLLRAFENNNNNNGQSFPLYSILFAPACGWEIICDGWHFFIQIVGFSIVVLAT